VPSLSSTAVSSAYSRCYSHIDREDLLPRHRWPPNPPTSRDPPRPIRSSPRSPDFRSFRHLTVQAGSNSRKHYRYCARPLRNVALICAPPIPFDIPGFPRTLRFPPADLQSALCVRSNHEAILDSASQSLRFCQSCASIGFPATLFQFAAFTYCPVHRCTLRDTSEFGQNQPPKARFETSFGRLFRPIIAGSITPIPDIRRRSGPSIPGDRCRWHN